MIKQLRVGLGNLYLSLSDAIDLADASIAAHQMRTAYIAWQIAKEARISQKQIELIFLAALFHDVGAITPEDKLKLRMPKTDLSHHCKLGEALFCLSPLLEPASKIILYHHTPWKAFNRDLFEKDVLESQIVYLSDLIERLIKRNTYILHQVESITSKILSVSNKEIHPDLVDLFIRVSKREEFWLDIVSPRLYSLLLHEGPFKGVEISFEPIYQFSLVVRSIIDFSSSFTATHSSGVAECAWVLSQLFGFTDFETKLMKIAGNFHDLGKLAIPNSILEKPGPLTKEEFAIIKQHTYHTYTLLNTISGMEQISEWAAFHHEKLDGSGYPFHLKGDEINTGARIMAVADIFVAIAEDRPYRKGMPYKNIRKILTDMVNNNFIDKRIVNLLLENYKGILDLVKEEQEIASDYYIQKFESIQQ